jgi:hypothetical protein
MKCNNNISLRWRPIPLFGRPFRAIPLRVWFPGLKPWAILGSPFGRGRNVQTAPGAASTPHELRLHIERVMYYSPDDMFRLYMDQER